MIEFLIFLEQSHKYRPYFKEHIVHVDTVETIIFCQIYGQNVNFLSGGDLFSPICGHWQL